MDQAFIMGNRSQIISPLIVSPHLLAAKDIIHPTMNAINALLTVLLARLLAPAINALMAITSMEFSALFAQLDALLVAQLLAALRALLDIISRMYAFYANLNALHVVESIYALPAPQGTN
jgi:hypothetical protein